MSRSVVFCILLFGISGYGYGQATQPTPVQQPLNSCLSDFGTSFTFSAPPICSGSVEAELGFISLGDERFIPAVLTVAPFASHADITVLVNLVESNIRAGKRANHFGNRFDFFLRREVFERNGFVLTLAPRGAFFDRDGGGNMGVSVAAQYGKGRNVGVVNVGLAEAIGSSLVNPKTDYQTSFDYSRALSKSGFAVFLGFQYEAANAQAVSVEQGIIIPFRNGQVELAVNQLNLNTVPALQLHARVVMNWAKVFRR